MAAHQASTATRHASSSPKKSRKSAIPPLPPSAAPVTGQTGETPFKVAPAVAVRHTGQGEFQEASQQFSECVAALGRRTHRVGVVLRLMQSHFRNGLGDTAMAINDDDVFELLDLMAETLPHHYDDVNDPLDAYDTAAREEVKAAISYGDRVSSILEAMTTVARGDATVEQIEEAVKTVFDLTVTDPAYEPDWQNLVDVLATRGFTVTVLEHQGRPILPKVTAPKLAKLDRQGDRAVANLVKVTNRRASAAREMSAAEAGRR